MKFFKALRSILRVIGVLAPGLDAIKEEFPRLGERIDRWGDRLEDVRDQVVESLVERFAKPLREVAEALDAVLDSPALPVDLRAKLQRARDVVGLLLTQAG